MRREVWLLAAATIGLCLTGCMQNEEPPPETSGVQTPGQGEEAQGESGSGEEAVDEALACADIVPADVVSTLSEAGWQVDAVAPWSLGNLRVSEGVLCEWSAEEGEPMRYGWARVTSSELSQLSAWLLEEGLEKQDADGETLFTDPDTGETYLVTDAEELRYSSTLDGARAVQAPA